MSGVTRRAMLRGAAGLAVGLPFLELTSKKAHAQTAAHPKRFVVFFHSQGMIMDAWTPTGSGTSFQLSPILAPLAPHRAKLNVLTGIDNVINRLNVLSNGHNAATRTLLTAMPFAANLDASGALKPRASQVANGNAGGPSIDQVIASRIGGASRVRSLDIGVGGSRVGENQILFAGSDDPVTLEPDPNAIFARLFSDLPTGEPPPTPPPLSPIERLRAKRASVLDGVRQGFDQLRARAGAADRERLDAHAEKIRELERRLPTTGTPPMAGRGCERPTISLPPGYSIDPTTFGAWDNVSAPLLIDELVMALACDVTRVGTVQFTQYHRPTFPWLRADIPGRWDNWHSMIHEARDAGGRTAMLAAMTWYAEQFAYLLRRLDEVPEGDGTLLDNTLVLWISDFGTGAAHATNDLPIVLAGGLGGAMRTGQLLSQNGKNTGDLYTTILNLFGFDDTTFGFRGTTSGGLNGLAA